MKEPSDLAKLVTWQDYFKESKNYIRKQFGLELTIIEQVHLKALVQKCHFEYSEIKNTSYQGFDIHIEAAIRFLGESYGINPFTLVEDMYKFGGVNLPEYFQKLQQKMHLP